MISQGWVKICLTVLVCAGLIFAWKAYEKRQRLLVYDTCVERFTRTARDQADLNAKLAMCQMQYTGQIVQTGIYSPQQGRSMTLAMTRRPDI